MEILESLKSTSPGKVSVDSRILEKDLHPKLCGGSRIFVNDVQWR